MTEPKKVFKWIGIGCGVITLLGILTVGACVFFIKGATDAPADTSHLFFAHLRGNDFVSARAMMSPEYQAAHPLPQFQQAVALIPPLTLQADSTFNNRNISNGTATMTGFLTTVQGSVPVTVSLRNAGEVWTITSVVAGGQFLQ